jgi:hypothetical protein
MFAQTGLSLLVVPAETVDRRVVLKKHGEEMYLATTGKWVGDKGAAWQIPWIINVAHAIEKRKAEIENLIGGALHYEIMHTVM